MAKTPLRLVDVKARERVYDGFFKIDRAIINFTDADGGLIENATVEVAERGDSAAAFLHDVANKRVILTEQFRFATYEKGPGWLIEAAAGSIEAGETPEQCIRRELAEELGYEACALEFIARYYVSPGGVSERVFLYYCAVSDCDLKHPDAHGIASAHESVKRVVWSEAEFFAALDCGVLEDAKVIIAGLWLRRRLEAEKAV